MNFWTFASILAVCWYGYAAIARRAAMRERLHRPAPPAPAVKPTTVDMQAGSALSVKDLNDRLRVNGRHL